MGSFLRKLLAVVLVALNLVAIGLEIMSRSPNWNGPSRSTPTVYESRIK